MSAVGNLHAFYSLNRVLHGVISFNAMLRELECCLRRSKQNINNEIITRANLTLIMETNRFSSSRSNENTEKSHEGVTQTKLKYHCDPHRNLF